MGGMVRTSLLLAVFAIFCTVSAADAACFADYKAKRDNPLRLHYGVVQLRGACSKGAAAREISGRIRGDGWQLLNVLSVFDDAGLKKRQKSAGPFFLRY